MLAAIFISKTTGIAALNFLPRTLKSYKEKVFVPASPGTLKTG